MYFSIQRKKKVKLRRSDPKSLQQEDSDTVWNELAYHRRENKNLMVEKYVLTTVICVVLSLNNFCQYTSNRSVPHSAFKIYISN